MKMGRTTETGPNRCPHCHARMERATGIDHDRAPKPGDIAICIICANWFVYQEDLHPRKPNTEEMAIILTDPILFRIRAVTLATARRFHRKN